MTLSIRSRLLVQNLLATALGLGLVLAMILVALWQFGTRQANERLTIAMRAVESGIASESANLKAAVQRIAGDKDLSSKANFLQENADKPDMASMIVQERGNLAVRFGRAMAAAGASDGACYGGDGKLLCAATNLGDSIRLIISGNAGKLIGVSLAAGKEPQPGDWKPAEAWASAPVAFLGRQPTTVTVGCTVEDGWTIRATAPLLVETLNPTTFQMELAPRGSITIGSPLGQAFLVEQEARTGLHLHLYTGGKLVAGSTPDFTPETMPKASAQAPADGLDPAATTFGSTTVDGGSYFTAVCPMRAGGRDAGAVAVLASQADMRQSLRWILILTAIASVVSTAVALIVGWWMSRAITRPLAGTVTVLEAMAAGDTSRRLPETGPHELVALAQAVNHTVAGLRQTLDRTAAVASRLHEDAVRLDLSASTTAAAVARIAEQSASVATQAGGVSENVQTVAGAATEMTASIQEISHSATSASQVANEAVAVATEAQTSVTRLGNSSRDIDTVVKAIATIAAQTNLLALNATIEAARAGEAGRGFAVVASEVKHLARQTAEAAQDVAKRVHALQSDATGAVTAIGHIASVVGRINELQGAVAAAVEQQAATTNEITRNAGNASDGAGRIATAIAAVAQDAGEGSTGASDAKAAAERLLKLAGELSHVSGTTSPAGS